MHRTIIQEGEDKLKFKGSGKNVGLPHGELRYNLATKVMRNGVEVIVATDKITRPVEPEYLRILSNTVIKPITLAPHTLSNLMSMVLSSEKITSDKSNFMSIFQPTFTTKTFYTTYKYKTAIPKNNSNHSTDYQTIVTNVKTEPIKSTEFKNLKTEFTSVISANPTMQTEVYSTGYTYLNTIADGDQLIVASFTQSISNSLIGIQNIIDLEPSETFPTTNTYLKTIELTKTLTDGTDQQVISTKDIATQVIVTHKHKKKVPILPTTTDVTKTYFVTYTYFSTSIEGDKTKVKSDVSVSSDVVIEKFHIKPKKTSTKNMYNIERTENPMKISFSKFPFNIVTTKTYLTTFTYYTSPVESNTENNSRFHYRTKVVENVVTEAITPQNFSTEYLINLNDSLNKINGSFVEKATLKGGEPITINTHKEQFLDEFYHTYDIKPTKTIFNEAFITKLNQIEKQSVNNEVSLSQLNFSLYESESQFVKTTKSKINQFTAEALVANEENFFDITTPIIVKTKATPLSESPNTHFINSTSSKTLSANSFATQDVTIIPESENSNLKGESNNEISIITTPDKLKQPKNQTNVGGLLNLNNLGLNGISVLKPVFNAMAELINNQINKNSDVLTRRNDTVSAIDDQDLKKPQYNNLNPLLNFVNKFTPTIPKSPTEIKPKITTPLYIPVGSFSQNSDNEEKQDIGVMISKKQNHLEENLKNIEAKNFEKLRPQDPITILEGGIPISPGEIITTNSDVIIGRPGESGPRPPKIVLKNNIPIDMKPPPVPPLVLNVDDGDHFIGQQSMHTDVNFDLKKEKENAFLFQRLPPSLPKKQNYEVNGFKNGHSNLSDKNKGNNHQKNSQIYKPPRVKYDSGTSDLNPPPLPPSHIRIHDVHKPITINHEPEKKATFQKTSQNVINIPIHLEPNQNVENYLNPVEISSSALNLPPIPPLNQIYQTSLAHLAAPTPSLKIINQGAIQVAKNPQISLHLPLSVNQNSVERSTGHPLLVNIQPSQVANIVIPHGSSSALIVSGNKKHSLKGEVIDEPSPHPESETVGFVGAEPLLKIESEEVPISIHNEVISTHIEDNTKSSKETNRIIFLKNPQLQTELIKIRPKPLKINKLPEQQFFQTFKTQIDLGPNPLYSIQPQTTIQNFPFISSGSDRDILLTNHRQTESHNQNGESKKQLQQSHHHEGQNSEIYFNHNLDLHTLNSVKNNIGAEVYLNKNLNEKGQNINQGVPNNGNSKGALNSKNEFEKTYQAQTEGITSINSHKLHKEPVILIEGQNTEKGGHGIYIDISPPGYLSPLPEIIVNPENHSSNNHLSNLKKNSNYHQYGIVHEVPSISQVQLGSNKIKTEKFPLKEISTIHINNKNFNNLSSNFKIDSKFIESQNPIKKPIENSPSYLSPPPLLSEVNIHPFVFHSLNPPQSKPIYQKLSNQSQPNVPYPVDFMLPPPQIFFGPSTTVKTHLELNSPPVIPIGAGAPLYSYTYPKQEDLVIVPHKNQPTNINLNFGSSHKQNYKKRPSLTINSDLDTSGTTGPFKTEYGEEIQESIFRPLLPGEIPNELKKSEKNISTYLNNHKIIENSQSRPFTKIIESEKTENYQNVDEKTIDQIPVITGYWGNRPWSNNSSFWTNTNNNVQIKNENKPTSGFSYSDNISDSVFAKIKTPSKFVFTNTTDQSFYNSNEDFNRFENHRETYSFDQLNNKAGYNLSDFRNSTFDFNSLKVFSQKKNIHQNNSQKENTSNIHSGFIIKDTNELAGTRDTSILENERNKHIEFIKNKENIETQNFSKITNHKESHFNSSEQKQSIIFPSISENTKWNQKEVVNYKNDAIIKNVHHGSTDKKAEAITISKDAKPFKIKDHEFNKVQAGLTHVANQTFTNTSHVKHPDIYESNNKHSPNFNESNSSGPALNFETKIDTPSKILNIGESFPANYDSSKKSSAQNELNSTSPKKTVGYPLTNGLIRPISTSDTSHQNTQQKKHPSSFILNKKEELNVETLGIPLKKNDISQASETEQLPNNGNKLQHFGISIPSGFINKNESFSKLNLNYNYENKTINFYKEKPMSTAKEQTIIYNNGENETDKWFLTKYVTNSNIENDALPMKTNKLVSNNTQRNITFVGNAAVSSPNIQISVLTPPNRASLKTKFEEVMGLSPPPLERPRRPQKPQRPKPPYKFDNPTTSKSSLKPIAIENDFPPVRSPDFNKKPFKPQDIFPPRLPSNFVHHLSEYPILPPPQSRPRPTSLPIDLPKSSTTEKRKMDIFNSPEYDTSDPVFVKSEINGHSKPILEENPLKVEKKPYFPVPNSNKVKSNSQSKTTTQHQTLKFTEENGKSKSNSDINNQSVAKSSLKEYISPTRILNVPLSTTYHTKVTASVTPTFTQPYYEWQDSGIITGSEIIFDPEQFSNQVTPTINDSFENKKKIVTTLISTGSTTIFENLYTIKPDWNLKEKTESLLDLETQKKIENSKGNEFSKPNIKPTPTTSPIITTTLTVTSTMTTVVHSIGRKPTLKTVVVTKTLISTVFNKVTETKTLVQPTTATVFQTHIISTTKTALIVPTAHYPPQLKYPTGGSLKPEIFVADPHAKDTMTISVSSSMNKNKNREENRRPNGQTITNLNRPDKDSILVVMTNKHPNIELSNHDEINVIENDEDNEINESKISVKDVIRADKDSEHLKDTECYPKCKAKKNELCQKIDGLMKCVCRPGFARMFPDRPCKPTYTYNVKLLLEKYGSEQIAQQKLSNSSNMAKLTSTTKEGLDRMIMQSELRDIYHGIMMNGIQNKDKNTLVDFCVQLSENTDEEKLISIFKRTLQTTNYSLGGTELFASRAEDNLNAKDFNECQNPKFHDCSEHARCFNLKGTYTCSCKEGFTDISENTLFPGRVCSDLIGCEYCGYHGACYAKGEGQMTCECFQWYSGDRCNINLKVFLIALVTLGAILLSLLLLCVVFTCINKKNKKPTTSKSHGYLRYRGPSNHSIDRRAMITDSSSESSVDNLPYINPPPLPLATATSNVKKKSALRHVKGPAPKPVQLGMEQKDKSVTVMIPRAKYRPMPPLSPHLTMSTFSPDKNLPKTAAQIATEQKLINYLDGNSREEKTIVNAKSQNNRAEKEQQKIYNYKISGGNNDSPRANEKKEFKICEYEYKISKMLFSEETNSAERKSVKSLDDKFRRHSDSTHLHSEYNRDFQFRKYSVGALVSAGYEVSAKVGMQHFEEDTTEDDHSGILNTHTMKSNRSQFTTLNRTGDHKTMSEARSYEETTVHPQTRSLKTNYSGSSPSSRANNDEGHTMIERDSGSTFIVPESQLFKPEADRGSDISNFDSL